MLNLWLITFILELSLFGIPVCWRNRAKVLPVVCVVIFLSTAGLFSKVDPVAGIILSLLSSFRIFNMLRVVKGRMHQGYLRFAAGRTSRWLLLLHVLLIVFVVLPLTLASSSSLRLFIVIQLLVALAALIITLKNILKLSFTMPQTFLTDRELPTVTVAIPARNETNDLEACLQSVLANSYPKLEVIVLDDCSQSETAQIIKSFAHDGVRFVKGQEPAERWLAKNQAYQKLYEEASGELVLFCGVDVRLGPGAIRSMVNLLASRQKSMLSVLPVRVNSSPASAFIQSSRYWWELSLPRRLFNRPAVLSTCWMIGRQDLKEHGGFKAVSHTILPEGYFARELVKTDQYSFVRSSAELEVHTTKDFHEQYETAVRTRYPQLHRRPEMILFIGFMSALFLLMPFLLLISSLWLPVPYIWVVLATCVLLVAGHVAIVNTTDPVNSLLACITFPIVTAADIVISCVSMVQYEFFTVEWKDRNICIPVMHVIPNLPKLQ